jgi:hypothetical protein
MLVVTGAAVLAIGGIASLDRLGSGPRHHPCQDLIDHGATTTATRHGNPQQGQARLHLRRRRSPATGNSGDEDPFPPLQIREVGDRIHIEYDVRDPARSCARAPSAVFEGVTMWQAIGREPSSGRRWS